MGSFNRKECQWCTELIYDANRLCEACAKESDRCTRCIEYKDKCVCATNSNYALATDVTVKLGAADKLVAAIDQCTVAQYFDLPSSVQAAYHELRLYTKANGYNV